MVFKESDKVKVHGRGIGSVTNVIYTMVNEKETNDVYCYEMSFVNREKNHCIPR